MLKYLFFISFLVSSTLFAQNSNTHIDSIQVLKKRSLNDSLTSKERINYALKVCELSDKMKIDSVILKSRENLANVLANEGDYEGFKNANFELIKLAEKFKDSSYMAFGNHNLGWYYGEEIQIDSSYYYYFKAVNLYSKIKKVRLEGEVLLNMANIQESEKDYIGAEQNAVRAIKLIERLPKNENNLDTLWSLYNVLGVISYRLGNYNEAIEYHKIALSYSAQMKDNFVNILFSENNMALAHRDNGNYKDALKLHRKLLTNDLLNIYPEAYASYLNNLTYTKFKAKEDDVETLKRDFERAYKILDTIDAPIRLMFVANDRSEFFLSEGEKDSAYFYAKKGYDIGRETKSFDDVLESLMLMSKIENGPEGKQYLNEHIKLSDSLIQIERSIRNKFALIEFETDQIIAENEQISKERLIFLITAVGLLITLILLYIIISQRVKNKELRFSKAQQEANEEIYNLMLAQQDKVDEGRTHEKKRISEELHDGILGRLFGTRLSLDSLNFVNTEDAIKTRGQYIEELKSIEQEIRKISHDLNTDFVSGSGFSDIIQSYVKTQTQAYQLAYEYHEDDDIDWDDLSNKTKIHVYRMLQETMQNIYKHANAKHIKISFRLKNNVILLSVEDDGTGFNTNKARKGIGLKNFDSRASDIGGKVEIFSNPGEGTKVVIHVPTE